MGASVLGSAEADAFGDARSVVGAFPARSIFVITCAAVALAGFATSLRLGRGWPAGLAIPFALGATAALIDASYFVETKVTISAATLWDLSTASRIGVYAGATTTAFALFAWIAQEERLWPSSNRGRDRRGGGGSIPTSF